MLSMSPQTIVRKKNTGQTGNGGEFAGLKRDESEVTLGSPVDVAAAELAAVDAGFRKIEPGTDEYAQHYQRRTMAEQKLYDAQQTANPSSKAQVKRDTEARRQRHGLQTTINWAWDKARIEVEDRMKAASDQLDAEHGATANVVTDREDRIFSAGLALGESEGRRDGHDDAESKALGAIDDQINRIKRQLLDQDLTAVEVLERVREALTDPNVE